MTAQEVVDAIVSVGTGLVATGRGPEGIGTVAAEMGIDWDASLGELRAILTWDETDERGTALLAGVLAGMHLAQRHLA